MADNDLPELAANNELTDDVQELLDRARIFASKGKSESTKRAYRSDFDHFTRWCSSHGFQHLPSRPEVVGLYITAMANEGFATSTIGRRLVAISQAHKLSGFDSPTTDERVREIWRGIRRELDTAQTGKRPLSTVELRRILAELDPSELIDVRDAALLLTGYAGALRRSELTAWVHETDETKFVVTSHPSAFGMTNSYWEGVGEMVGR